MERGKSLRIFSFIEDSLKRDGFSELTGWSEKQIDDFIEDCSVESMSEELKYAVASGGRFRADLVESILVKYVPKLRTAPDGGWAKYCFDYILSELFPENRPKSSRYSASTSRNGRTV